MSVIPVTYQCSCVTPRLGIISHSTVFCGDCEGALGSVEDVMVSPLNPTLTDEFWNGQLADRRNACVIDGQHYRLGSGPKGGKFNGMGGQHTRVKIWSTGEVVETYDLWHQGTVPADYADVLPNDASFIRTIQVKHED